jgi:hypothetical protein
MHAPSATAPWPAPPSSDYCALRGQSEAAATPLYGAALYSTQPTVPQGYPKKLKRGDNIDRVRIDTVWLLWFHAAVWLALSTGIVAYPSDSLIFVPLYVPFSAGLVYFICTGHTCNSEFDVVRRELRHTRRYFLPCRAAVNVVVPFADIGEVHLGRIDFRGRASDERRLRVGEPEIGVRNRMAGCKESREEWEMYLFWIINAPAGDRDYVALLADRAARQVLRLAHRDYAAISTQLRRDYVAEVRDYVGSKLNLPPAGVLYMERDIPTRRSDADDDL